MASSLVSLSKSLNDDDLKITKSDYSDDKQFNLMRRKGVFPYDYLDSKERLKETH